MGQSYDPGVNKNDISTAVGTTNDAVQRQKDFLNALGGQNAIGNQNNVFASGLDTMNTLKGQANGEGPNPALAQLALTTGQNVKNQAALLAGQRGVGANPGLAARQIGQIGADVQQQGVGQGAALRANQQLASMQQLQQQQAFLGSLAQNQINQRQGAITGQGALGLGQSGQYLGALGTAEKTRIENDPWQKILGATIGAAGTVAGAALATGGKVPSVPGNAAGAIGTGSPLNNPMGQVPIYESGGTVPGKAKVEGNAKENDTVPAMLSPGEVVIPRTHVKDPKKVAAFINSTLGMNLKVGKKSS